MVPIPLLLSSLRSARLGKVRFKICASSTSTSSLILINATQRRSSRRFSETNNNNKTNSSSFPSSNLSSPSSRNLTSIQQRRQPQPSSTRRFNQSSSSIGSSSTPPFSYSQQGSASLLPSMSLSSSPISGKTIISPNIPVAGCPLPHGPTSTHQPVNLSNVSLKLSTANSREHIGLITSPQYRPPRNPIVLCHGLFGFDYIGVKEIPFLQLHYWKGIKEALVDLKCELHVSKVSSVSSVRTRAMELDRFLSEKAPGKSINLIAHSMGGLDSRYLITHLSPKMYDIASLTTIATPHRGSSFMDWIRDNLGVGYLTDAPLPIGVDLAKQNTFLSALDAPAFNNLTSEYCEEFNNATPDHPNVKYFSLAAVRDVPLTDPLHFSYQVIKSREGPNDGLVSLRSASYGQLINVLYCDHWDLTKVKNTKFDAIELYLSLVTFLHDQGL